MWNTLGSITFEVGHFIAHESGPVVRFGLWLCGLAGSLDGRADEYR